MTPNAAEAVLDSVADAGNTPVGLAEAALALAVLEQPDRDLAPHRSHLAELASSVADAATSHAPAEALAQVLAGRFGYAGDDTTYTQGLHCLGRCYRFGVSPAVQIKNQRD